MSWGEGSMNWAELRDLVDALPEDSATKAALAGDVDGRRWTQSTYIGASTYNALLLLIRVMWVAHLKGKPPEMAAIDPPQLQDDRQTALEAAGDQYVDALLAQYSPGAQPHDQEAIDYWAAKIRELET
ncbi:hypothetical protein ACIOEX_01640 [Streptomyces sp. NPDC087850]|uniref:hypothetical protein n=1 Tax=Streptomyces sp. NPDC087850 TaxID=3365809 RepID=UPI0037F2D1EB